MTNELTKIDNELVELEGIKITRSQIELFHKKYIPIPECG